jgi:hypothetical protein
MGIHGNFFDADSDILPVREVAMMTIMDKLTDKPDWHKKVFDDEIIAKWCKEALEYPDEALVSLTSIPELVLCSGCSLNRDNLVKLLPSSTAGEKMTDCFAL